MALSDPHQWLSDLDHSTNMALAGFEECMGYPPGDALFGFLEMVFLPDIWNGYFIGPPDLVRTRMLIGAAPSRLNVVENEIVIVFGSDGGGNIFATSPVRDGTVLRVSDVWEREDGILHGSVEQIASNLDDFLDSLLSNVRAFRHGRDPSF